MKKNRQRATHSLCPETIKLRKLPSQHAVPRRWVIFDVIDLPWLPVGGQTLDIGCLFKDNMGLQDSFLTPGLYGEGSASAALDP